MFEVQFQLAKININNFSSKFTKIEDSNSQFKSTTKFHKQSIVI